MSVELMPFSFFLTFRTLHAFVLADRERQIVGTQLFGWSDHIYHSLFIKKSCAYSLLPMSPYCLIGNPPSLILTSFRDSTADTCSRKRQPPTFDPRIGGQTCLWSTQLYLFVLARNLAQVPMCQVGNISHKNGAYDAPGCPCRKNVESGIWDVWYTACFICNTGSNFHPCHPLFRTKPAFMPTMGTSSRPLQAQSSSIQSSNLTNFSFLLVFTKQIPLWGYKIPDLPCCRPLLILSAQYTKYLVSWYQ